MILRLWWFVGYILDGLGCLFCLCSLWRASSFALVLHWRWRHRGKCRWLVTVTPEPHRHQLPATIPSSPLPTTPTYHYIAPISHPLPPYQHQLTHRNSRHSSQLANLTPHRQHGSRGHHDRVRATISGSSSRAEIAWITSYNG